MTNLNFTIGNTIVTIEVQNLNNGHSFVCIEGDEEGGRTVDASNAWGEIQDILWNWAEDNIWA